MKMMKQNVIYTSVKVTPAILLFFTTVHDISAQNITKPNILWLVIEDTSPQNIGCYGSSAVNTPNIDKLAEEGVRFTNAYSTGTSCAPSRSTIITGVRTYKMGTGNQRSTFPIPDFIKGFPYYLKQAGYYTTNNSKTDYNTSSEPTLIQNSWHENSNTAGWWKREPGQPFFAVFNIYDSHQSRTMTESFENYQNKVLNYLPDSLKISDNEFEMPPYLADNPKMRKQYARMYNSISLADFNIGKQLDRLEDAGLMDSTIIFFYADHGQGMPRIKTNGIGQGYKVPFVIWFPEMYKHLSPWGTSGVVTSEQINFSDLAATMLSIAGIEIPGYFDGRAFLGGAREEADEYMFVSNDRVDNGLTVDRAVIKDSLVYIRNFTPISTRTAIYTLFYDR
jgi:arylsulfatase A-like enzyme